MISWRKVELVIVSRCVVVSWRHIVISASVIGPRPEDSIAFNKGIFVAALKVVVPASAGGISEWILIVSSSSSTTDGLLMIEWRRERRACATSQLRVLTRDVPRHVDDESE